MSQETVMSRRQTLHMLALGGSTWISKRLLGKPQETGSASRDKVPSMLIRGGQIVTEDQPFTADVRVRGEKIVKIGSDLEPTGSEDRLVDARGLLVLPGGIDPHAHLSPPWVDDYTTGSHAALAGGITTIGSMVSVEEGESLPDALNRETQRVTQETVSDIVLHPILRMPRESTRDELSAIVAAGHRSLKIFMLTRSFEENESRYREVIRAAGQMGILTLLHCEDASILAATARKLEAAGQESLRYYAESRPVESEVVAVERAIRISHQANDAPIYIVHLSSAQALEPCTAARRQRLPVHVETRPLYLHFTKERYLEPDGALFVGQPPLREKTDVEALWKGLATGDVDTVGTDHAPWTREQKLDPELNITRLRPGVADLQTMLPVLYSEGVVRRNLSLARFVAVTSTNAAKLLGLYPNKGTIRVGSDADICVWDPAETRTVRREDLFSRAGFSVCEGMSVTGWPRVTIRRGEVVYERGRIQAPPGSGRVPVRGPIQVLV